MRFKKISPFAVINGYFKNPSEELVNLWLETKGYITMHNIYYYARKTGKSQGAWRDIDIIGVGEKDIIIVQASTGLGAKMNFKSVVGYFRDAEYFLEKNKHYKWLFKNKSKGYLLAYINPCSDKVKNIFRRNTKNKIELRDFDEITKEIEGYVKDVYTHSTKDGRLDNSVLHFYRRLHRKELQELDKSKKNKN
jgi:hypothetical protein